MQYFLRDHLGSVRVIAEDRHTVISRTDYLPFGVRMSGDGLTGANFTARSSFFGFSGKENEMWGGYDTADGDITPHWLKGERYQHFGARAYDPVSCIFMQVDPMAEKYYGMTSYGYCAGNPVMMVDPDGLEPSKDKSGFAAGFVYRLSTSGTKSGQCRGKEAEMALLRLSEMETIKTHGLYKPVPRNTGAINNYDDKYIYTTKAGWLDMNHFMFYAGCGYRQKTSVCNEIDSQTDPMATTMSMAYSQELLDLIFAPHSAFSYEDLPSDYYGAYFAIYIFNPNSDLSLGKQILEFLESLGATSPQQAPNYESLPEVETSRNDKHPSSRNFSNIPKYVQ